MKIRRYGETDRLLMRSMETSGVGDTVRAIIADVAENGDAALLRYAIGESADAELVRAESEVRRRFRRSGSHQGFRRCGRIRRLFRHGNARQQHTADEKHCADALGGFQGCCTSLKACR